MTPPACRKVTRASTATAASTPSPGCAGSHPTSSASPAQRGLTPGLLNQARSRGKPCTPKSVLEQNVKNEKDQVRFQRPGLVFEPAVPTWDGYLPRDFGFSVGLGNPTERPGGRKKVGTQPVGTKAPSQEVPHAHKNPSKANLENQALLSKVTIPGFSYGAGWTYWASEAFLAA